MHAERDELQVQEDVDDVFLHAFDAGVLMEDAVDFDFRDGAAWHGREKHATEGVAERMAKAALERLDHDARLARGNRLYFHDTGLQEFCDGTLHFTLTLPTFLPALGGVGDPALVIFR
jgi:hypothetical protein